MAHHRKLPHRENVFVHSLMYHGYRFVHRRQNLKWRNGYIIPATMREDSSGVDFWVKCPRHTLLIPVQITQRGVRLYRKHQHPCAEKLEEFVKKAEARLRKKRQACTKHGIAFVLVRDFDGKKTNPTLAWGDVKALRYGVQRLKR